MEKGVSLLLVFKGKVILTLKAKRGERKDIVSAIDSALKVSLTSLLYGEDTSVSTSFKEIPNLVTPF